jgi:hypothetical protein
MRLREDAEELACKRFRRFRIFAVRLVENRVGNQVIAIKDHLEDSAALVFLDGPRADPQETERIICISRCNGSLKLGLDNGQAERQLLKFPNLCGEQVGAVVYEARTLPPGNFNGVDLIRDDGIFSFAGRPTYI